MTVNGNKALSCKELVELVTDYLEGELDRDRLEALDAHLAVCEHCGRYVRQMRMTIGALRQLAGDDELPSDARERLLEAFAQRH
jgi:anti-sigma factor RsiW